MTPRAWCIVALAALASACADKTPPAERAFDTRASTVRYARYDFKDGLVPIGDPAKLDEVDASFVVIRDHSWPDVPREQGYYIADMRGAKSGLTYEFTARLVPRKDIIVHAMARQEGLNRAAGITFLAGELANLTPGSDRERSTQDARAKFFGTDILPPERDPRGLAEQNPKLPEAAPAPTP